MSVVGETENRTAANGLVNPGGIAEGMLNPFDRRLSLIFKGLELSIRYTTHREGRKSDERPSYEHLR